MTDALAGTVDLVFDVTPPLMPHVANGSLRPLIVASRARLPMLPGVPGAGDLADLGLGDLDIGSWNGIAVPARTPAAIVTTLHAAVTRAAADPGLASGLAPFGFTVALSSSPDAFAAEIARQTPGWLRLIERSGARVE